MSDYKGAALMLPALPKAKELLADKGYDADWFRAALAKRGVADCIPSKSNRKVAIPYDALLYKQRHKIENMFGRLKDWRRIHTLIEGQGADLLETREWAEPASGVIEASYS